MSTFVPAIMWGIVSQGSFALTNVLERASGSGYAAQAGQDISHGSARFGDISMNNVNSNKHDTSFANTTGIGQSTFLSGAGQHISKQIRGGVQSSVADQTASMTLHDKYGMQYSTAAEITKKYGENFSSNVQAVTQDTASFFKEYGGSLSTGEQGQGVFSSEQQYANTVIGAEKANAAIQAIRAKSESTGHSAEDAFKSEFTGGFQLAGSGVKMAKINSFKDLEELSNKLNQQVSYAQDNGITISSTDSDGVTHRTTNTEVSSDAQNYIDKESRQTQTALNTTLASGRQYDDAKSMADSYKGAYDSGYGATVPLDMTQGDVDRVKGDVRENMADRLGKLQTVQGTVAASGGGLIGDVNHGQTAADRDVTAIGERITDGKGLIEDGLNLQGGEEDKFKQKQGEVEGGTQGNKDAMIRNALKATGLPGLAGMDLASAEVMANYYKNRTEEQLETAGSVQNETLPAQYANFYDALRATPDATWASQQAKEFHGLVEGVRNGAYSHDSLVDASNEFIDGLGAGYRQKYNIHSGEHMATRIEQIAYSNKNAVNEIEHRHASADKLVSAFNLYNEKP